MSQPNPVKETLQGAYYYEEKNVRGKTRKDKYCSFCSSRIPAGSSHKGATIFSDEFRAIAWCDECDKKYSSEILEMKGGEYDSY